MNFLLLVSILVTIQHSVQSVYTEEEEILNYINFALSSYRKFYNANTNFVYSPLALSVIYNILYQTASGNAEIQLQELLFANTKVQPEKYEIFKCQTEILATTLNSSIKLANKFYVNYGVEFDPVFKYFSAQYQAASESIDFSRIEEARSVINNWAGNQTNGMIMDLIQPGQIQPFTDMMIINTAYFKAEWLRKYSEYHVHHGVFQAIHGGTIPMKFIEDTQSYDISFRPALGLYAVRLPYKTGFEFWIILPFANYPFDDLVKSLTPDHINDIEQNFQDKYSKIKFPIFTIESRVNGKDAKPDAFFYSDFQLTEGFQRYAGAIIQKVKITVNTDGTEAASGTYSDLIGSSSVLPPEPFYFIADRPFLYAVMADNNKPVLIGHYTT